MSTSIIKIQGDRKNAFAINRQLEELYQAKEIMVLCLDVRECNFMNSYILGSIIYYHSLMMKQNRKIIWLLSKNKDDYMNRMFEITGLEKLFDIIQDPGDVKNY